MYLVDCRVRQVIYIRASCNKGSRAWSETDDSESDGKRKSEIRVGLEIDGLLCSALLCFASLSMLLLLLLLLFCFVFPLWCRRASAKFK